MTDSLDDVPAPATGGDAATAFDEDRRAEQRPLELRILAQNRALREKQQQLLETVERLQEKEEAAELMGTPFARLFLAAAAPLSWDERVPRPFEGVGLRKDGSTFPLELSVSRWSTPEGEF